MRRIANVPQKWGIAKFFKYLCILMEKEYIVTVDGKPAGRVVGRERLGEIAPLVAEETEVFVVYDANAAEVAAEVIEAVPGVRGSIAIETSEEANPYYARNLYFSSTNIYYDYNLYRDGGRSVRPVVRN